MKVDRTKYTAHYENGIIVAQWISVEMALDAENEEGPLTALDRSQEIVDQWYKSKNIPFENNAVHPGTPPVINIQRTSEDIRIAELVKNIYSCTQLDGDNGLFTYFKLASTCKEAQLAYDIMKNQLVSKESKEILDTTETLGLLFKESGESYESLNDNK